MMALLKQRLPDRAGALRGGSIRQLGRRKDEVLVRRALDELADETAVVQAAGICRDDCFDGGETALSESGIQDAI